MPEKPEISAGSRPPIWRRIEIPSAMRLGLVHEVMQVAFDWHDYHLHAFETVCGEFGTPDDGDDWSDRKDETTAALAQVAAAEKAKVVYAYDFGDDWRHDIVVEKITPAGPGVASRAYLVSVSGGLASRARTSAGGSASRASFVSFIATQDSGTQRPADPGAGAGTTVRSA